MLTLLRKLWSQIGGHSAVGHAAPSSDCPKDWPDEDPLPALEPTEPSRHYVLPLRWSLHYALTRKQWSHLRQRQKELFPDWNECACPNRCKANTLDEKWRYDHGTHTKVFVSAAFICPGCHWLKTPPWRIRTWLEQRDGLLPVLSKPPHVIDCLGWTQAQVDVLRDSDLERHRAQKILLARLDEQVEKGRAVIVPSPPERLSPPELQKLVRPGKVMVVPWRVDLSALAKYGYSPNEIVAFEERMYKLAAKRMCGNHGSAGRRRG